MIAAVSVRSVRGPFVTSLKAGSVRVQTETGKENFKIEKGFLAVHKNEVIILVSK